DRGLVQRRLGERGGQGLRLRDRRRGGDPARHRRRELLGCRAPREERHRRHHALRLHAVPVPHCWRVQGLRSRGLHVQEGSPPDGPLRPARRLRRRPGGRGRGDLRDAPEDAGARGDNHGDRHRRARDVGARVQGPEREGPEPGQPVPHHHDGPEHGRRPARHRPQGHRTDAVPGPCVRHGRGGDSRGPGAYPARRRRRRHSRGFRGPDHAAQHGRVLRDPRDQHAQRRAVEGEPSVRRGPGRVRDERGRGGRGPRERRARGAARGGADRARLGLRSLHGRLPRDGTRHRGARRRARDEARALGLGPLPRGRRARQRARDLDPHGRWPGDEGGLAFPTARGRLRDEIDDRTPLRGSRGDRRHHVRPRAQAQGPAADDKSGTTRRRLHGARLRAGRGAEGARPEGGHLELHGLRRPQHSRSVLRHRV
ncbi:MAG: 3-oxoacyl-[acyl-carrier-protein] synthase, KASII, partial [uncultured Rubrobacteraceae bacterium]